MSKHQLFVSTWPDRKLPLLTEVVGGTNSHTIWAKFNPKDAADVFMALDTGGIFAIEEDKQDG